VRRELRRASAKLPGRVRAVNAPFVQWRRPSRGPRHPCRCSVNLRHPALDELTMRIGNFNIGPNSGTVAPEQKPSTPGQQNSATGLSGRTSSKSSFAPRMSISFSGMKQSIKQAKQELKSDMKSFKSNVSGMGASIKQQFNKMGGSPKPPTTQAMSPAQFKAEASKIAGEILTEKAGGLANMNLGHIQGELFAGDAKPLAEGNGDLRRLATLLEASAKVSDVSALPEHMQGPVAAMQQFYARPDVKDNLIQACSSAWHQKDQSLTAKITVGNQLSEAKSLLTNLNEASKLR
jgi:hypothetical protein